MAEWEMIACPKDQGGLGINSTKVMNNCLLVKWIWEITKGVSQFWQGLHGETPLQVGSNCFGRIIRLVTSL